jgi:hypothetical protein
VPIPGYIIWFFVGKEDINRTLLGQVKLAARFLSPD